MRRLCSFGLPAFLGILCYALLIGNLGIESVTWQKWVDGLFFWNPSSGSYKKHPLEESFCYSSLDEIGNGTEHVVKLLNNITSRPFFRYFKLNLEVQCPYWAVQFLCTGKEDSCQICSCDANDVPEALRYPHDMSDPSVIESRVSHENVHPTNIDKWGIWKNVDAESTYVDLLQNPEGNTGYSGPMATRVWRAIYRENCITEVSDAGELGARAECKEEQVFKKLISGLHTSISLHVAAFYDRDKDGNSPLRQLDLLKNHNISYYPNCLLFERVVKNLEFTNNLYVLYQFVLRALTKAKTVFLSHLDALNSGTGGQATVEDKHLHAEIQKLFNSHLLCSPTFNEAEFLDSKKAHQLVPQMKRMMHNITTLMNCVTCEKCRVWGKVQTMGLASALKIVMRPSNEQLTLSRGEKVSLLNLARQLAISVRIVHVLPNVCLHMVNTQKS